MQSHRSQMAVWRVSVLLQAESLKLLVIVLGLLKLPEPRNCKKNIQSVVLQL